MRKGDREGCADRKLQALARRLIDNGRDGAAGGRGGSTREELGEQWLGCLPWSLKPTLAERTPLID